MGRRSRFDYFPLNWQRIPVDWYWAVAFKKPRSGKLLWIYSQSKNERAASTMARELVALRHPGKGYVEYGMSKTYVRLYEGGDQQITYEEYEKALLHQPEWLPHLRRPVSETTGA